MRLLRSKFDLQLQLRGHLLATQIGVICGTEHFLRAILPKAAIGEHGAEAWREGRDVGTFNVEL